MRRFLVPGVVGLVVVLAFVAAGEAAEEVARIPVNRPCVVVVERTAAGGVRVVLEFEPAAGPIPVPPKPNPDPAPGPDSIEGRFDAALEPLGSDSRAAVLDAIGRRLPGVIAAVQGGTIATEDVALAALATQVLSGELSTASEEAGMAAVAAIHSIVGRPGSLAGRLNTLSVLVRERTR